MENMKRLFPSVFSGLLGCIKDFELELMVDESVKPVKQKLRPVVFHMREAVEEELWERSARRRLGSLK